MAIKISSTDVIDNSRQIVNATGGVFTSGAGIVTATSYRGDGSQLTGITVSAFPSGTLMLFQQTTAPVGWAKSTTHNNKALRVVSGAAGSGGSTAFTTVFSSRTPTGAVSGSNSGGTVGNHTLLVNQIPAHSHVAAAARDGGNGSTDPLQIAQGIASKLQRAPTYIISVSVENSGGGGSHNHTFTNPSWSGSFTGTAMDFAVQYVDLIIASKI